MAHKVTKKHQVLIRKLLREKVPQYHCFSVGFFFKNMENLEHFFCSTICTEDSKSKIYLEKKSDTSGEIATESSCQMRVDAKHTEDLGKKKKMEYLN